MMMGLSIAIGMSLGVVAAVGLLTFLDWRADR